MRDQREGGVDARRLAGRRVLVAEDEFFVAQDIALAVEDAGGSVVGPFATLADAATALARETPDAAVLDVDLKDGRIDPVLARLKVLGSAVVVNTGSLLPLDPRIGAGGVLVFTKPSDPRELVEALVERLLSKG